MCKSCRNKGEAARYYKDPQQFVDRKNRWKSGNWLRAAISTALLSSKRNAIKRGIPHTVVIDDLKAIMDRSGGKCELSGLPFERAIAPGRKHPLSPSLDRIRPELGYVAGNLRLICDALNGAKGCGTDEDLLQICKAYVEKNT